MSLVIIFFPLFFWSTLPQQRCDYGGLLIHPFPPLRANFKATIIYLYRHFVLIQLRVVRSSVNAYWMNTSSSFYRRIRVIMLIAVVGPLHKDNLSSTSVLKIGNPWSASPVSLLSFIPAMICIMICHYIPASPHCWVMEQIFSTLLPLLPFFLTTDHSFAKLNVHRLFVCCMLSSSDCAIMHLDFGRPVKIQAPNCRAFFLLCTNTFLSKDHTSLVALL